MERLASSVRDFVSEQPKAGYNDIVARFGTPEQVAGTYLSEMDSAELMDAMQIRKKVLRILIAAAAVVILLWAGVVTVALLDSFHNSGGHGVVTIVEE